MKCCAYNGFLIRHKIKTVILCLFTSFFFLFWFLMCNSFNWMNENVSLVLRFCFMSLFFFKFYNSYKCTYLFNSFECFSFCLFIYRHVSDRLFCYFTLLFYYDFPITRFMNYIYFFLFSQMQCNIFTYTLIEFSTFDEEL